MFLLNYHKISSLHKKQKAISKHRIWITISRSVNHDLAKHRADRDRRSVSRDRDLGSRSSDWSSRDRRGLELGVRRRSSDWTGARSSTIARSLSLSLSLSGNTLKGKWKCKMISVVKANFFSVNGNQFLENSIFRTNQTSPFPEKHFRKWFSPKTNTALEVISVKQIQI